jgi:hypothetical protein
VVLTDWAGHRLDVPAADMMMDLADRLIVCCTGTPHSQDAATSLLTTLRGRGWARLASTAVIVSTKLGGAAPPARGRAEQAVPRERVVHVPFDLHLSGPGLKDLGRLKPRTTEAFVRLAALVLDGPPPSLPPAS